VVDSKPHIRTFLSDALDELGFIAHSCPRAADVTDALKTIEPDLVVLGLLTPESEVTKVLLQLGTAKFAGKVMLFGGRAAPALLALHNLGEELGLAMLPPLRTPFRDSDLAEILAAFLPVPQSRNLPVEVDEALRNGWLELWYQPKVDLRQMSLRGAEALIRMRHPTWGVIAPAFFIPADSDPQMLLLSEFVVERAMADWAYFIEGRSQIDLTVHLPMSALEHPKFIDEMCLQLPDHSALTKLIVEIDSMDLSRDPMQAREAAKRLGSYNVGLSIDDVTAGPAWSRVVDFPVAELQVDSKMISGSANDRGKRKACGTVLNIAGRLGARTVAKGISTTTDFHAARDMGFDLGQGFLFGRPMETRRFARTMLRRPPGSTS